MAMAYEAIAGTATVELRILGKDGKFSPKLLKLNGCFVKRDANLNAFIDKSFIADNDKYESCKYLFYSYLVKEFQGSVTEAVIRYRKISKDKKSDKEKDLTLKNEPLVIRFNGHFFLCCDFKDICKFKHSAYPKKNPNDSKFLHDYSTVFKIRNLGSTVYGLGRENSCLRFFSLDVTQCQSEGSNIYRIRNDETRCIFDKLNESGPLLLRKDDKTKHLVGCYKKSIDDTGNCRIKIDMFEKSQASHAIDGGSSGDGTGQAEGTQSPTDGAGTGQQDGGLSEYETGQPTEYSLPAVSGVGTGQARGNPPPGAGVGTGQAQGNPPPGAGVGTGQARGNPPPGAGEGNGQARGNPPPGAGVGTGQARGNPPPAAGEGNGQARGNPPPGAGTGDGQQILADLFRRKTRLLDGLCLRLDNEYRVVQNWRHLADLLKAPYSIKDKCKCRTRHSPTELLLEVPKVSSVTIARFITELKNIYRNDVVRKISDRIPETDWNKKVSEAILNDYELCDEVAQMLDQDTSLKKGNWRGLGQKLGVPRCDLNQIGTGNNPANELFLYAYKTIEPEKLKTGYFRSLIENRFPKRNDVKDFLDTMRVTLQDNRSLKDVFPPESDNLRSLCEFLNQNAGNTLKDWKHLASAWEIENDTYKSFDDQGKTKPTEILLQWLIQEHVDYTVGHLCAHLREMKRNDVREYLEEEARR